MLLILEASIEDEEIASCLSSAIGMPSLEVTYPPDPINLQLNNTILKELNIPGNIPLAANPANV